MPKITLPDGSCRVFSEPLSVMDVALDIGPGLAKATLAGKLDGKLVDASTRIFEDSTLSIITSKDEEGLEVIRHSSAHLLAMAVQDLYKGAQVTIGPVIEDGFYYDFAYERAFNLEDLDKIEKRMYELAKQNMTIERVVIERSDAIARFKSLGEEYKVKIIEDLPESEKISIYRQNDWMDLCRGPHVPNTSVLKAFKLMRVAGAYWRGDSNNEMLTRIYGTAWSDKKALKNYLYRLEEAEKRDHRKLGKHLKLFHLQDDAPGMVFWHPDGWTVYQQLENFMRKKQAKWGYQEVKTPQLLDRSLWEKSGHWEKYKDDMFTLSSNDRDIAIKPMNCPCHVQIFNQGLRSYRELPLRLAEFGSCHRDEASGALHGLMRVKNFVQDDAHIFVTEEQIQLEVASFIDMLHEVYAAFGFSSKDIQYHISTRPKKRVGSDAIWDKAEGALKQAIESKNLPWQELAGEGAFYGPKIDIFLKDCLGRVWQCGTIQADFSMPKRLDASYIDSAGLRQTPVMLHRAILGSIERFLGILIEHFEGNLPTWLAAKQIAIISITNRQMEYANELKEFLIEKGFRVQLDLRNEKIGFKIREHTLKKIPYLAIIGDKELKNRTVAIRTRSGEDLGVLTINKFVDLVAADINKCNRTVN